jgi:hypothetical protein
MQFLVPESYFPSPFPKRRLLGSSISVVLRKYSTQPTCRIEAYCIMAFLLGWISLVLVPPNLLANHSNHYRWWASGDPRVHQALC